MTEERLEKIRAMTPTMLFRSQLHAQAVADLLAEVDRLRSASPSRESGALLDVRALAIRAVLDDALSSEECWHERGNLSRAGIAEYREKHAHAVAALATLERDAARMRAIDDDLDDLRWIRPSFHADGPLVELDWFVGDGGGSTLTTGATISEAVDAYLAAPETSE